MRRHEDVKAVLVRQWMAKADQDLLAAETLHEAVPTCLYPACFHAQQAVEKYLKALLTWEQVEFRKTHDLSELARLLEPTGMLQKDVLEDVEVLNPYGVEIRYPGDLPEPTRDEADSAISLARKVRLFALNKLDPVLKGEN